jgi:hypothetical protein
VWKGARQLCQGIPITVQKQSFLNTIAVLVAPFLKHVDRETVLRIDDPHENQPRVLDLTNGNVLNEVIAKLLVTNCNLGEGAVTDEPLSDKR